MAKRRTRQIASRVHGRMVGRPTMFTPERCQRIVQAIRVGNCLEPAAHYGGISYQTFNEWVKRGDDIRLQLTYNKRVSVTDGDQLFAEFSEAVHAARAEAEVEAIGVIRKAMFRDWRPAAWWAERSNPQRWGRRLVNVEVTGRDGRPIEHADVTEEFTDAERLRRLRAACALVADGEVVGS